MRLHEHGPARDDATCHEPGSSADLPTVALVGRPNVGKSTFLARASRRFVETSNAPGTTVFLERRRVETSNGPVGLVDLPGTRSLDDVPAGDSPFWQLLLDARPDAIVVVVDAGDLARHLPLVLACRDLGLPIVVAANLSDEAEAQGVRLDTGRLGQLLVAPVVATCGRTGRGVAEVLALAADLGQQRRAVAEGLRSPRATVPVPPYPPLVEADLARAGAELRGPVRSLGAAAVADPLASFVDRGLVSRRGAASLRFASSLAIPRADLAERWSEQVERRVDRPEPLAERLSRIVTAPWPGLPLFVLATIASFLAVIAVGGVLSGAMTSAWTSTVSPALASAVSTLVPVPVLARATLWALDGGLLAMLTVGIPYVLTFYLLLAALEDSGYLTSAAVLTDRVFGVLGLPGRAAIPLLTASGCNVPAVQGTRILRTRRERVLAAWLVTLTPCSARSAVVIAAVAPFAGVPAALGAFALVLAITIVSGIGANAVIPGRQPSLVLELAPLRRPIARHVAAKAWFRFRGFVVTATPFMLAGSFVVGLAYESGAWAPIARFADPVVRATLGLPAIAAVAIVFAFLRKELALQLLVALAAVHLGAGAGSSSAALSGLSTPSVGSVLSAGQLFVFAVVTSISIPCVATLATLRGELGGRTAATISGASVLLALGTGTILARILGVA